MSGQRQMSARRARKVAGAASAALGLALAFAPGLQAQDWKGQGRFEGRVVDPDGKPVADAVVKIELPGRGGTALKTDKKGRWVAGGVAAGPWNIDVEAPGFTPRRLSFTLPGESARMPPTEIKLERAAPQGPPPEVVEAVRKGDEAFKAGRYAEARSEYEKLLALRPDLATTLHRQIAYTYSQEKNYAKVIEHLEKVLAAEPENLEVKTLIALEAIEGGMLDRGLEILKTIDESQIKNPEVFYNVGAKFRNLDRPEDAAVWFGKAVTADPTYVDGYLQRALTYFGLKKYAESKADFEKVLELSPQGPQADLARKALADLQKMPPS